MKDRIRVRRRLLMLVWAIMLAFVMQPVLSVAAQEQVDNLPTVNNYTSARFDLLTTVDIGGFKAQSFGKGAVILPDRVSLWVGTSESDQLTYVIQIGTTYYFNDGSGWERSENMPLDNAQALPISEQLARLQQLANAILKVGPEPVRGISATHYQVWLSGERLLEFPGQVAVDDDVRNLISQATIKYDFWIGDADGRLYQQNTVVMLPETTINDTPIPALTASTLITYYDINDPSISIQPPI